MKNSSGISVFQFRSIVIAAILAVCMTGSSVAFSWEQVGRSGLIESFLSPFADQSITLEVGQTTGFFWSRKSAFFPIGSVEYCTVNTNSNNIRLSLSPTGPFTTGTINNFPFYSNASGALGYGSTPLIYANAISPVNSQPVTLTCPVTSGNDVAYITVSAPPNPTPTPTPTPVTTLKFQYTSKYELGVDEPKVMELDIQGETPNASDTVTILGTSTSLSFATAIDGPYTPTLQRPITLSSIGTANERFFVKGHYSTAGASSLPQVRAGGTVVNIIDSPGIKIYNVAAISLETYTSPTLNSPNIALDNNPATGGGQRIFPEKKTTYDPQFAYRSYVRIRARLSEPVANVKIRMKLFDVDDPSTDDLVIDGNGSEGNDNRDTTRFGIGSPGTYTYSAYTDSNGEAIATLIVGKQPGDNYRVAAAATFRSSNYLLDEHTNIVGDDLSYKTNVLPTNTAYSNSPAVQSKLLTVWRKLHIERDSMGPVKGNSVSGQILSITAGTTTSRLALSLPLGTSLQANRFINGRIFIHSESPGSGMSFKITKNLASAVYVEGTVPATVSGWDYTIYDDDDFNRTDTTNLDGDSGEDIPAPDMSLLQSSGDATSNMLAPAYILPTYDLNAESTNVPFVLNIPSMLPGDEDLGAGASVAGIRSLFQYGNLPSADDPDFWTVYVLMGYQGVVEYDVDPETESSGAYTGVVDQIKGQGALILVEEIKEKEDFYKGLRKPFTDRQRVKGVIVHEIGHLLGSLHGDGAIMCDLGDCPNDTRFSPTSIAKFRSLDYVYHEGYRVPETPLVNYETGERQPNWLSSIVELWPK